MEKILSAMKENPNISTKELILISGLTRRGVEYNIDKLKKDKVIKRIGPDKGGKWAIL